MNDDSGVRTIQSRRRSALLGMTFAMVFVVVPAVRCQSPAPATTNEGANAIETLPAYDVVSIKPNNSGSGSSSMGNYGDMYRATNVTLKILMAYAYKVGRSDLISGLRRWADSSRFDLNAKVSDPNKKALDKLTREQRQAMLRAVLEEQFHVKGHWETKEMPIYELVVAKGGPKFKETSTDSTQAKAMAPGTGKGNIWISNREMNAYGIMMASLAVTIAEQVQRNVVDKTGLTGRYDFTLKWASQDPGADDPGDAPPMSTALQEQLGLKLQPAREPVETLVVDNAEMPIEN
jgi:uncharacterized protein (TIGR03435 family)